jgi:hypothetical protein
MLTLVGMLTALAGGATVSAVLAGLSITDWIAIAGLLLKAGEDAVKVFTALHPELKQIEADLLAKKSAHEIASKAHTIPWDVPSYDDPSKWGGPTCLS